MKVIFKLALRILLDRQYLALAHRIEAKVRERLS